MVDTCIDSYADEFREQLAGCAKLDNIPGESCLTPEKAARLMTRSVHEVIDRLGIICIETATHEVVSKIKLIIEVAGCTEFIDG